MFFNKSWEKRKLLPSLCVCVYTCACMYVWHMWTFVQIYVEARGQCHMSSLITLNLIFEKILLSQRLAIWLGWLVASSKNLPTSAPDCGVAGMSTMLNFLKLWMLGIWTQFFMHVQLFPYPLSQLPCPKLWLLLMFIFVFKLTNLFLSFLLLLNFFCYVSFLASFDKCLLVLVAVILFNTNF